MLNKFLKISIILLLTIGFIIISIMIINSQKLHSTANLSNTETNAKTSNEEIKDFSVSKNGWLCTSSTKLKNENNQDIQLTGVSSHGIQWYSDIITYDNLKQLKDDFNINIFRVAMYSEAYVANPEIIKQKLFYIVDNCINLDMYVIIDWHILADSNPNTYYEQSNAFFNEISLKYKDTPNVLYEICNEPNGNAVTWDEVIKPYAEKLIPTIRNNNPKSLIIVGTPDWCKKLKPVANNPLNFDNISYSCHFYSGSHGKELQENIDYALSKNICLFVSECGLTDATGNGEKYFDEFNSWIKFLNERKISWIFWSFSNKDESSSILLPNYPSAPNSETHIKLNDYLSDTGKFIKKLLINK